MKRGTLEWNLAALLVLALNGSARAYQCTTPNTETAVLSADRLMRGDTTDNLFRLSKSKREVCWVSRKKPGDWTAQTPPVCQDMVSAGAPPGLKLSMIRVRGLPARGVVGAYGFANASAPTDNPGSLAFFATKEEKMEGKPVHFDLPKGSTGLDFFGISPDGRTAFVLTNTTTDTRVCAIDFSVAGGVEKATLLCQTKLPLVPNYRTHFSWASNGRGLVWQEGSQLTCAANIDDMKAGNLPICTRLSWGVSQPTWSACPDCLKGVTTAHFAAGQSLTVTNFAAGKVTSKIYTPFPFFNGTDKKNPPIANYPKFYAGGIVTGAITRGSVGLFVYNITSNATAYWRTLTTVKPVSGVHYYATDVKPDQATVPTKIALVALYNGTYKNITWGSIPPLKTKNSRVTLQLVGNVPVKNTSYTNCQDGAVHPWGVVGFMEGWSDVMGPELLFSFSQQKVKAFLGHTIHPIWALIRRATDAFEYSSFPMRHDHEIDYKGINLYEREGTLTPDSPSMLASYEFANLEDPTPQSLSEHQIMPNYHEVGDFELAFDAKGEVVAWIDLNYGNLGPSSYFKKEWLSMMGRVCVSKGGKVTCAPPSFPDHKQEDNNLGTPLAAPWLLSVSDDGKVLFYLAYAGALRTDFQSETNGLACFAPIDKLSAENTVCTKVTGTSQADMNIIQKSTRGIGRSGTRYSAALITSYDSVWANVTLDPTSGKLVGGVFKSKDLKPAYSVQSTTSMSPDGTWIYWQNMGYNKFYRLNITEPWVQPNLQEVELPPPGTWARKFKNDIRFRVWSTGATKEGELAAASLYYNTNDTHLNFQAVWTTPFLSAVGPSMKMFKQSVMACKYSYNPERAYTTYASPKLSQLLVVTGYAGWSKAECQNQVGLFKSTWDEPLELKFAPRNTSMLAFIMVDESNFAFTAGKGEWRLINTDDRSTINQQISQTDVLYVGSPTNTVSNPGCKAGKNGLDCLAPLPRLTLKNGVMSSVEFVNSPDRVSGVVCSGKLTKKTQAPLPPVPVPMPGHPQTPNPTSGGPPTTPGPTSGGPTTPNPGSPTPHGATGAGGGPPEADPKDGDGPGAGLFIGLGVGGAVLLAGAAGAGFYFIKVKGLGKSGFDSIE